MEKGYCSYCNEFILIDEDEIYLKRCPKCKAEISKDELKLNLKIVNRDKMFKIDNLTVEELIITGLSRLANAEYEEAKEIAFKILETDKDNSYAKYINLYLIRIASKKNYEDYSEEDIEGFFDEGKFISDCESLVEAKIKADYYHLYYQFMLDFVKYGLRKINEITVDRLIGLLVRIASMKIDEYLPNKLVDAILYREKTIGVSDQYVDKWFMIIKNLNKDYTFNLDDLNLWQIPFIEYNSKNKHKILLKFLELKLPLSWYLFQSFYKTSFIRHKKLLSRCNDAINTVNNEIKTNEIKGFYFGSDATVLVSKGFVLSFEKVNNRINNYFAKPKNVYLFLSSFNTKFTSTTIDKIHLNYSYLSFSYEILSKVKQNKKNLNKFNELIIELKNSDFII